MSGSSRSGRNARPRSLVRTLSLFGVVALLLGFYTWTAATSVGSELADRPSTSASLGSTSRALDPSNRLADAFVHGRLNLDIPVPQSLRAAKDIHDPAQRGNLSGDYLDLAYYKGSLYSAWGPVPALVLFAPAHLLGLGYVSQALAVLLFSAAALILSVALLDVLSRRFFPGLSHGLFLLAVLVVGTGSLAPYILRRPEVYEVSLAAALCFSVAALLCFVTGLSDERASAWRLALGSLFAGLAFGCRPPVGIVLFVGLGLLAWRWRSLSPGLPGRRRLLVAALVPFAVCAVAYGAYNQARFHSPADFGVAHQLQVANVASNERFSASYLSPGLWYYAFAPPRLRLQFPYLWLPPGPDPPVPTPSSYGPSEPTGGVLPTLPIVLLLVLAPWALRRAARELGALVAGLVAVAAVLLAFLACLFGSATMRYEVDFRTFLLLAALMTWFAAMSATTARRRRILRRTGVGLAIWGIVATVLISFTGEKNRFVQEHLATLGSLARFFGPLPTAVAQVEGHPLIAGVGGSARTAPWRYDRLSLDGLEVDVGADPVSLQVISPSTGVFRLRGRVARAAAVPAGARLRVGVSANGTGQFGSPADRIQGFPIRLDRGINDVKIEAAYDVRRVSPPPGGVLRLEDLRVR